MTSEELDGATNAERDLAPADTNHEVSDADRAANPFGAARDERGRFAGKQDTQPKAEGQQDQPNGEQPADGQPHKAGTVPHQALAAARGKQREAESEAAALRRELAELRGAFQGMQRQPQAAPQPATQQQPPQIWEDPDGAISYRVRSALDPVAQSLEGMKLEYSKQIASLQHGEPVVSSAIEAIKALAQSNPAEFQQLEAQASRSMHPVDVLVRWHKQQRALAEVGNDPDAWRNQERERIRQEILAEVHGASEQQPAPATQPPRLPNSFAAPRPGGPRGASGFGGPRPLSEIMPRG